MTRKDAESYKARKRREARERMARLAAGRKASGLCPKCGDPPESGFTLCVVCREKGNAWRKVDHAADAARTRKNTAKRKAEGRCIQCGRPNPDSSRVRCPKCRADRADRHKREYDARVAEGVCVYCGRKDVHRFRACMPCRMIIAERAFVRRSRLPM